MRRLQLVMRCLDGRDVVALARTCRDAFSAARDAFAWASLTDVTWSMYCAPTPRSLLPFVRSAVHVRTRCVAVNMQTRCEALTLHDAFFASPVILKMDTFARVSSLHLSLFQRQNRCVDGRGCCAPGTDVPRCR
jgi:hypothetical protein